LKKRQNDLQLAVASQRGGIYDHKVNSGVHSNVFIPFISQKQDV